MSALEIKILAGLGLLVAVLVGFSLWNRHQQTVGAAVVRAEQAEKDLTATKGRLDEEHRRTTEVQTHAEQADQKASAARADADAARTAGDRLRVRLAAAERQRNGAGNPAPPSASAPASDTPEFVPWPVFERVRGAAGIFAAFADDLSVRLDACVGSYDALNPANRKDLQP